jgi:hypothetical protein
MASTEAERAHRDAAHSEEILSGGEEHTYSALPPNSSIVFSVSSLRRCVSARDLLVLSIMLCRPKIPR